MPETTYLEALAKGKCPRCRKGKIFPHPTRNLRRFSIMNEHCPVCGVRLEPEPGFYQGAMYVSYAFTVALLVILGTSLYLLGNPSEWTSIGIIIGIMLILAPLNYRYSRILFLYLFGGLKYRQTP
jgi:uncharacterized protein (DUF983 family)